MKNDECIQKAKWGHKKGGDLRYATRDRKITCVSKGKWKLNNWIEEEDTPSCQWQKSSQHTWKTPTSLNGCNVTKAEETTSKTGKAQ